MDRGLQAERTGLAWYRTASAAMLVALFSIYIGFVRGNLLHVAAAALAVCAAIWMLRHGRNQVRDGRLLSIERRRAAMLAVSLVAILLASLHAIALLL